MNKELIEQVLGTTLSNDEFTLLQEDWHEFCTKIEFFKKSVVVDMVKQWLAKTRKAMK